ncbi:hypothetical protein NDU88_007104 [Pleurodeles waltl]|uniref:Uncharacterized protein n=1 Tax=Pleurodeles waltl TaxID=8319 RepID=A0AAV7PLJ3_PLEWA|nr:hypothetical protein NDU88_007104 [Pleurodeles waltl]
MQAGQPVKTRVTIDTNPTVVTLVTEWHPRPPERGHNLTASSGADVVESRRLPERVADGVSGSRCDPRRGHPADRRSKAPDLSRRPEYRGRTDDVGAELRAGLTAQTVGTQRSSAEFSDAKGL